MPGTPSKHLLEDAATASQEILREIEGNRPEGTHGIDQQAAVLGGNGRRNVFDRIQDAGCRLAVNYDDMTDIGVVRERPRDGTDIWRRVLRRLQDRVATRYVIANLCDTVAVGAVYDYEKLTIFRQEGSDHCLDSERTAPLNRYGRKRIAAARHIDQSVSDILRSVDKGLIARAPIVKHCLLCLRARRQRTGR